MAVELSELTKIGVKRAYPTGQIILYQGDQPDHVFMIKSGHVKIYELDQNGNEQFLYLLKTGDLFPVVNGFKKVQYLPYFYGAFDDVEVQMIPREELIRQIDENATFSRKALNYFVERMTSLLRRVEVIRNGGAGYKVGTLFVWLMDNFGTQNKAGNIQINLRLTHQDLANMCGLTRETTSLQLKSLEESKIIKTQKSGEFSVNPSELQDFLDKEVV